MLLPFAVLLILSGIISGADQYLITVATVVAIWAMLALGLNMVMGYSGLINLGIAAFFAIGAYGAAFIQTHTEWSPWLSLVVLPLLAAVVAAVLGPIILRTRGLHFAVATLGIGMLVSDVLVNWVSVTNGSIGIAGITRPDPIDLGFLSIDTAKTEGFFWLTLIILIVVLIGAALFQHSQIARVLVAARDDELLAKSLGFSVSIQRVIAFVLSGVVAAIAGVVYAWFIRYVSPDPFSFFLASFPAFVMVAIGGPGSIWGAVLGAAFVTGIPQVFDFEPTLTPIFYGVGLLVVMVLLPMGLVPGFGQLFRRYFTGRSRIPDRDSVSDPRSAETATATAQKTSKGSDTQNAG